LGKPSYQDADLGVMSRKTLEAWAVPNPKVRIYASPWLDQAGQFA